MDRRTIPRTQWAEGQEADVCASYIAGETQASIARKYGKAIQTITRVLKLNGIEIRPSPGGYNKRDVCKRGHERKDPNLYYHTISRKGKTYTLKACKACTDASNSEYYYRVRRAKITKKYK